MVLQYLVTARLRVKISFFWPFLLHKVLWCFTCFVSPDALAGKEAAVISWQGRKARTDWFCFNHLRRDSIFEMFAILQCNELGRKYCEDLLTVITRQAGLVVVMVQGRLASWDITPRIYIFTTCPSLPAQLSAPQLHHNTNGSRENFAVFLTAL